MVFLHLSKYLSTNSNNINKLIKLKTMNSNIPALLERAKNVVPPLNDARYKGQAGRIGIFGGSLEYTGAPYFSAISSLKVGADLVHIFCSQSAATVIKSYSPELIVHPLLDTERAIEQIGPWLERLHVIVIGPGLGRDRNILNNISELIRYCRNVNKPLIIDADGLHLITIDNEIIKNYSDVILTPNAIEFSRLFGRNNNVGIDDIVQKFGNGITVLEKGATDKIYDTTRNSVLDCPSGGSGRRCGGQGDLLSGAIAIFYHWAIESNDENPKEIACFAASYLIKECNKLAYQSKGRSMICTDMIEYIHQVFDEVFETK